MANQGADDNRSIHELAIDIVQDIGLLSTALAHAGAPPNITEQVSQPIALYSGVAKALAAGPIGAQPVSAGGQQGAAPGGAPAPSPAPSAPAPGPVSSGGQINGSSMQAPAQGDLHNAIVQMHHDAQGALGRVAR